MILSEILRHSAHLYREKVAIKTDSTQITYYQFADYCRDLGKAFYGLGLKRGERIAFLDLNSLELAASHFAVPGCGLVILPLNHRLSQKELIGVLSDAKAAVLVYAPEFSDLVDAMRSELDFVKHFVCTKPAGGALDLRTMVETSSRIEFEEPEPDDLATLLYTSGTTGRPKGVKLSHANTCSTLTTLLVELGLTPSDIGLMVAPLFHVAGCHTYMALIARGCTVHLQKGFEPEKTLKGIDENKATVSLLVPAMIGAMLKHPEQERFNTDSLRLVIYAGAPMPEELLKSAISQFGDVFFQIYGLTETSVLTCLKVKDHNNPEMLSSAGREMYGCHLRLVDQADKDVLPGEIGHIIARGDNVTSGYWNAPDETSAALKNGWFYTGDVAIRDEKGFIFLKDRKKDMIVTGGENVYPVEVENILQEHPAIDESAVIGIPDDQWGEKVVAFVTPYTDYSISELEIIEFCRERLAGYKCPKQVRFKEELPRTPSGKVRKNVLRAPYWEKLNRGVH